MSTSKTFRLFISSTFGDFRREREVLQTKVFPYIRTYCLQQGFSFQPIDLRWGVSAEAQLDQKTLELCLEEVGACKTYQYPNFLIMAGDRYGWVPLPYAIEEHEYETLLGLMSADEQTRVNEWYTLDRNQIPASYILHERTEEHVDFNTWAAVENTLRTILQTAVNTSSLTEDQKRKYFLSATEAEVEEGIIPYLNETKKQQELLKNHPKLKEIDPKHIFGFFRDIDKSTQIEKKFIENYQDYEKAQAFKGRVRSILPDSNNVLGVQTTQFDKERLDEEYLEQKIPEIEDESFEYRIKSFLESQIDAMVKIESENNLTSLDIEIDAQRYFAEQKRENFIGQQTSLDAIAGYIASDNQRPLIIYGPSGRGKSSLMTQAIKEQAIKSAKGSMIYRFVGATPHSGSSTEILTSIFVELGINVRSEEEEETFEQFSYRIHDQIMKMKDITIFIDAVDQLGNDDQFLWLPQTLPSNVKIIISALDDVSYPDDSKYFQTLQQKTTNLHEIPEFNDPITLLQNILANEQRTLQEHQETYFLKQFHSSPSPLYITIAAQEMKHWKSTDTVGEGKNDQKLASSQKGIIDEFISNLKEFYHHNEEFVNKVLGYLYASRDGLSESELLQLLTTDESFIQKMAPETWHQNPTKELPMVHWSRLHTQLKPFLSIKRQDNEDLMYFFHREFTDAIRSLPTQKDEHIAIVEATQKLITEHRYELFDSNRWGKLYATLITEYELRFYTCEEQTQNYELKSTQKRFSQFIAELENEEWIVSVSSYLSMVSLDNYKHNRMYETIAYKESYLQIFEPLYQTNPDRWAKEYAAVLGDLAMSYYHQNRLDEAIKMQEKSLRIREPLYQANPDRWAEDYTGALANLALLYRDINRLDEAIKMQEKSLQIRELLYQANPDRWAEDYTGALANLAISYRMVSRLDEAIKLLEKSLQILEALYQANPGWVEYYTKALDNLAISYYHQNRLDEAIKMQEKSLQIRESLYQANPDRWAEDYTTALGNLSGLYSNINRLDEAITLQEKSLRIREPLYQANPHRWAEDYTGALANLAVLYRDINHLDEAIKMQEKSLQITEVLYQANPDQWVENYTGALVKLAISYRMVNRLDEAIKMQEKSLRIREPLYQANPDRWAEDYTAALGNLAMSYQDINRPDEAIKMQEKSLQITEVLYQANPDRWAKDYTAALGNLAISYRDINRLDEAITLEEKSLQITEVLYQVNPDRWAELYTAALNNLAASYQDINRLDEAITLEEKSLQITEVLYQANPDRWAEDCSRALGNLAMLYYSQNRLDEAIKLQEKSLQIRELIYQANPDRWAKDYTKALGRLASLYKNMGLEEKWAQVKLAEKHYKHTVMIEDLCQLAKYSAYKSQDNEIQMIHIIHAMSYINFDYKERDKFSQLFDLKKLPAQKQALIHIELAKVRDDLPYGEEIEELVEEMMEYYQNKTIGRFW